MFLHCVSLHIYIYIYLYMYICTCIYIHTHIYVYIYLFIHDLFYDALGNVDYIVVSDSEVCHPRCVFKL